MSPSSPTTSSAAPCLDQLTDLALWEAELAVGPVLVESAGAGANFVFPTLGLMLVVLAHRQHLPSLAIALLAAASGLGGTLGAALAPFLLRRMSSARLILASVWLWLLLCTGLTLADPGSLLYVAVLLPAVWGGIGFAGAHLNIALKVYQVSTVPQDIFGRVTSSIRFCSSGTVPAGAFASGYLIAILGPQTAVFLVAATVGILAIVISCPASGRTWEQDAMR